MAVSKENDQFALVVSSNTTTSSYEGLLESQKELISKQISQLQNIVSTQCKLTGLNPLSQEMAAGALSIKIGKRPRDLLNPKAIKYMQSIFSVKDEISKKEIRAISALFSLTATQVRDFFTGQRSRVRRFIRLSKEKAVQSAERVEEQNGPSCSNLDLPVHPVPLNSMDPSNTETPSCSMQDEILPGIDDSDKYFIANIFNLLRKEETFSGQVKLMEWILKIQNAAVLYWFLTNGGVMILATWLSQAAIEEQTSVLHVILRVLCHLPLHKALPPHMSAILQSVNKLRFYRGSDISNRAKSLLSRWSKMFARSQAMRKPNATVSSVDAQNEMLLKQSIGEIMENESLESKIDTPGVTCSLQESFENSRNSGSSQSVKLLTEPSDDSNIKLLRGVSSHTRERRKVQLVEQPGQKVAGRSPQVTRVVSTTQGRPLSADDIQKQKMRAQFMRSKYGDSYIGPQTKSLLSSKAHVASKASVSIPATDAHIQPKVEDHKKPPKLVSGGETQEARVRGKESLDSEEPVWKKCKRFQIPWTTPPEMKINKEWSVCCGENSKEVEVQNNRIKREKEVFYATELEIPANPREPWDREMDYDDSLTPEIPTEQLPDNDNEDMVAAEETSAARENLDPAVTISYAAAAIGGSTAENTTANMPEPDLELLAVLLKNPEIVFALTSGQGGSLTNEQTVKLLDAIKANGGGGIGGGGGGGGSSSGGGGNITNGFVEERVEVSLPSPTPSSDPVTSGWRPENVKNPFSGQNVTVNGEAYAIPGVYFQETRLSSPTPAAPSPTQQTILPAVHRRIDRSNIPAGGWSLSSQGVMTPSSLAQEAISPPRHDRFTADRRNFPVDLAQEAISPRHHRFSGDRRNIPVDLAQEAISPPRHHRFSGDRRNISAVDRGHGAITPSETYFPPQPQSVMLEPRRLPAQSWTGRKGLASSSYSLADHSTKHDAYGTREFVQPGPPWVRHRGYRDEPGFESWSSDRDHSPRRAHEHAAGSDIGYSRSYDYRRHETSRTPYNPSRYRDRGGRDVNSRRRNRRR